MNAKGAYGRPFRYQPASFFLPASVALVEKIVAAFRWLMMIWVMPTSPQGSNHGAESSIIRSLISLWCHES